jgi:drug/metabolite transporter (DMT)-like permease
MGKGASAVMPLSPTGMTTRLRSGPASKGVRAEEMTASKPAAAPSTTTARTVLLAGVLIASGCLHAVLQEQLFEALGHGLPLFVTSFEFGCCSFLSLVGLLASGGDPLNAPKLTLLQISTLVLFSLVSGNVALRWVSYPVKVVVKSCKLLPTMALGSLLLRKRCVLPLCLSARHLCPLQLLPLLLLPPAAARRPLLLLPPTCCHYCCSTTSFAENRCFNALLHVPRRYTAYDQLAAVLLCAGLVGFTLAGKGTKVAGGGASNPFGVAVLLFAVSCDAVQVLLSERMLKTYTHLTPSHVMLYTNGFAFLAVVSGVICLGELENLPERIPWFRASLHSIFFVLQTLALTLALAPTLSHTLRCAARSHRHRALHHPTGLCLYGACSWVSVSCFVGLTRSLGATAAVVATNARKLLSVVLSFILFPKPFGIGFALSGVAVIAGVYMHQHGRAASRKQV